jgi:hypothetical protein
MYRLPALFFAAMASACLVLAGPARACTSFASYGSDRPFYGMNFDWYPDLEIVFSIDQRRDGGSVFTMSYLAQSGDTIPTVGMNDLGLFSTMQVVDESVEAREPAEGEVFVWMPFYLLLWQSGSIEEVEAFLDSSLLVPYPEIPLHLMLAGSSGKAMVVEVGESSNRILPRGEEGFLVMTNFSHHRCRDLSPADVEGVGADRYRAAWAALSDRSAELTVDSGLEVLRAALNGSADFPTRATMLFDPDRSAVYVAPRGNTELVWKFDLEDRTARGWRGVSEDSVLPVPSCGLGMASLDR